MVNLEGNELCDIYMHSWTQMVQVSGSKIYVTRLNVGVKSGSSGLKSDGGSGREMEVSHRGGLEVRRRYEGGGLSKDLA